MEGSKRRERIKEERDEGCEKSVREDDSECVWECLRKTAMTGSSKISQIRMIEPSCRVKTFFSHDFAIPEQILSFCGYNFWLLTAAGLHSLRQHVRMGNVKCHFAEFKTVKKYWQCQIFCFINVHSH